MSRKENALHRAMRQDLQNKREDCVCLLGRKCQACGNAAVGILELHHLIPISGGGSNDMYNLALLCPNCHRAIHTLDRSSCSTDILIEYFSTVSYETSQKIMDLINRAIELQREENRKVQEFYKNMRGESR